MSIHFFYVKVAKKYRNIEQQNLPPHVYQVARSAHFAVLHKRKNQVISVILCLHEVTLMHFQNTKPP